jgi:hypothetical protein
MNQAIESGELTLVTAASSGHFRSLLQFLLSVRRYEPRIRCIVYSLGLEEREYRRLKRIYPHCEVRVFDYSKYPPHFDITIDNGAYAWKPAIIWELLGEKIGPICWMDSGNVLISELGELRRSLARRGFYSPYSPGTLKEWTHPGMLGSLGLNQEWCGEKRNLNGACIAFDPNREEALRLAKDWQERAMSAECIVPEGANRSNHRYDQALLSVLAYERGMVEGLDHEYLGFKLHQDAESYPLRAILRSILRTVKYWRYSLRSEESS